MPKIFGREPAAIVAAVQAVLAMLVGFGVLDAIGLSTMDHVAIVTGAVGAALAVWVAWATNETLLSALTELFKAGAAVAAIYGLNLTAEQSALVVVAIQAVGAAWLRQAVVPLEPGNRTFERLDPVDAQVRNQGW